MLRFLIAFSESPSISPVAPAPHAVTAMNFSTDAQMELLTQLKKCVSDILPPEYPDVWLFKWLNAHNCNLKKTEARFRGCMRARQVYEVDTLIDTYVKPQVVSEYEFTSFLGFAKNGSPVRYTRFGAGDYIGFLMSLSSYDLCYYGTYVIECDLKSMREHNKKVGKEVHEITYILDLEGFSIRDVVQKNAIEAALDLISMMQDHYPEMWGDIFLINAPSFFDKGFNIFKPILGLNMLKKIRVAAREGTSTLLLQYISEDVLPAFLGGKRIDSSGNPRCPEFVKFGGRVPEELYLRNRAPLLPSDRGATARWIGPRAIFNYSVVIRGTKMRVEIRSENGSIGCKMLYRPFGDDPLCPDLPSSDEFLDEHDPSCNVQYVSPGIRLQTHISPIDHIVRAPWPGIYIFRFDNSSGWFTSRRVIFRIREVQDTDY